MVEILSNHGDHVRDYVQKAEELDRATVAMDFFRWALDTGQSQASSLGYVPLPAALVRQIEARIGIRTLPSSSTDIAQAQPILPVDRRRRSALRLAISSSSAASDRTTRAGAGAGGRGGRRRAGVEHAGRIVREPRRDRRGRSTGLRAMEIPVRMRQTCMQRAGRE
jgi:hypothetical protein